MAVLSGLQLAVSGIPSVAAWMIQTTDESVAFAASNTQQAISRICGTQDWEGQIVSYGHTPAYKPRDSLTFVGSFNGQFGVTGPALVTAVSIRAQYDSGHRYITRYSLAGQGPLTFGTAQASDTTTPTIACPLGNPVYINGTELTDVAAWELWMGISPVPYVASDTGGFKKKLIGVFDVALTIERHINTVAPPEPGTICSVELVVEPAQDQTPRKSWQASNLKVLKIDDYGANLDLLLRGERPRHTITFGLASAGRIVAPDGAQWWPFN